MGATQRVVRLTPSEAVAFFDTLAREFMSAQRFHRIDGRRVIAVLNLPDFADTYGEDGLRFLLRLLRARLQRQLGEDPFLIGLLPDGNDRSIRVAAAMPCDAVTGYGLLPDWAGPAVQDYSELMDQRAAEWYRIQRRIPMPFLPVVCVGWDASRRGTYAGDLRGVRSFPWRPIIVGSNPRQFGLFLDRAVEFLDATASPYRVVYVHAWNEWSEGSAVEPGVRFGDGYLLELKTRSTAAGDDARRKVPCGGAFTTTTAITTS